MRTIDTSNTEINTSQSPGYTCAFNYDVGKAGVSICTVQMGR